MALSRKTFGSGGGTCAARSRLRQCLPGRTRERPEDAPRNGAEQQGVGGRSQQ